MPEITCNGLAFHVEDRGSGEPLVLLHGFTGSSASWSGITDRLDRTRRVIAIDLIGHGRSPAPIDPARYAFDRALDDLACVIASLGVERAGWLGYSMGGRVALALAIRYPALVSSLVLESASPGIEDAAERASRRAADDTLASRIEAGGIAEFVAAWERLPMWDSQRSLPAAARARQREIRLRNQAHGLAGSLRGMGVGAQEPFWHRLSGVAAPALLIAGTLDTKFARIATRMHSEIPGAELCLASDAGHAVHLERPDFFARQVERFLDRIDQ